MFEALVERRMRPVEHVGEHGAAQLLDQIDCEHFGIVCQNLIDVCLMFDKNILNIDFYRQTEKNKG